MRYVSDMKKVIITTLLIICVVTIMIPSVEGFIEIKKYKVINSPKVCGDKLCSEMDERRAKKGESSRDIKVCGNRPCYDIESKAYEKITHQYSPIEQLKLGVPLDMIQCKPNLELILKASNNNPACVSSKNVQKLIDKGWALPIEAQNSLFEQIAKLEPRRTLEEITAPKELIFSITPDVIAGEEYLVFNGFGWHRLHNVEITISNEIEEVEFLMSQTSDHGVLFLPWKIPEEIKSGWYNIYATEGIHEYEVDVLIGR